MGQRQRDCHGTNQGRGRQELTPPCVRAAASLPQKWGPMSHLPLAQEGMRHTLGALTDTVRRFGC